MSNTAEQQMPQPTAEHLRIQKMVGKWDVDCTFYMDPSQPPMKCAATEVVEAVGPFWVASKYETNFMGAPFLGHCTLGFDANKKVWVSTWIDSMSSVHFLFTGTQKGDTITMTAKAWSCMTNMEAMHRTTSKHISENEWIFEMFQTMPDGKEIKMMTSHYRRA